ncbi:coil containing protein [Vibrio phage 1.104.O._10N.286.49.A12]|nr:coil containing protein [Vibrio phage 1.104.O._10N.286.49.A12]
MNQISADHEKLRNVLISKLGLPTDRFQRDNQIAEAVEALVLNKRSPVKDSTSLKQIKKLLNVRPDQGFNAIFDCVKSLTEERDELKRTTILEERDELQGTINHLEQLLELNKSQLSEIRYVLHGDIQPCSVLYSDDTTTLLRLDEGDIMCETDTIEWSDSVTYRCQELLKGESKRSNIPVTLSPVKLLAQLVRDERILLNDNGDDESVETVEIHTLGEKEPKRVPSNRGVSVVSCTSCPNVYPSSLSLCPQCHTPKQER